MAQDYTKRLILPLEGNNDIEFYTKSNLEIANGYNRIVIGLRGPYIEFHHYNIISSSIHKIINPNHYYFDEYRSNCKSNVKVYYQKFIVNYADYKPGFLYISPFDLISDKYPILITSLERKKK